MSDPAAIAALIVLGLAFIAIEVLVVPGVGIPGILGTMLGGAGCYFAWTAFGPVTGVATIAGTVAISLLMGWWVARSRVGRRMVLEAAITGHAGPPDTLAHLRGQSGIARSPLRPTGLVEVGGRRYEAVAEGGAWIDSGAALVVVGITGKHLVVASHLQPTVPGDFP